VSSGRCRDYVGVRCRATPFVVWAHHIGTKRFIVIHSRGAFAMNDERRRRIKRRGSQGGGWHCPRHCETSRFSQWRKNSRAKSCACVRMRLQRMKPEIQKNAVSCISELINHNRKCKPIIFLYCDWPIYLLQILFFIRKSHFYTGCSTEKCWNSSAIIFKCKCSFYCKNCELKRERKVYNF